MRKILALLAIGLGTLATAAGQAKKTRGAKAGAAKTAKAQTAKTATAVRQVGNDSIIPAGASKLDEHTWMAVDASGTKWFYRKGPFGVTKTDKDVTAVSAAAQARDAQRNPFSGGKSGPPSEAAARSSQINAKVVDLGDAYSFERATPFGLSKWTRKKADLTDADRALIEASKPQPPVEARN